MGWPTYRRHISHSWNNDGCLHLCSARNFLLNMDTKNRCQMGHRSIILSHPPHLIVLTPKPLKLTFSAGRPLRNKFHELFRWTHILLTIGFVFAAYYHQPQTMLPILIVMCLLGLEWLPRLLKMALPIPRATTQILNGNVVRITIPIPTNRLGKYFWGHWEAGSHIRITIPSIGLFQTHPLTIASIPSDGNIRLYIRARTGFTRRVYERAAAAVVSGTQASLNVHIEGIYGGRFPSFAKFDVVLLIAGGIGATFTVPILRDLVNRAKQSNTRRQCKRLAFVWVVKNRGIILQIHI